MRNELEHVPVQFHGFDLYRYRPKAAWAMPSRPPTLEECAESCWANSVSAAAELAKAQAIYDRMGPGEKGLGFAMSEIGRLRAERTHWKGLQQWHLAEARKMARGPRLPRDPGEDDE